MLKYLKDLKPDMVVTMETVRLILTNLTADEFAFFDGRVRPIANTRVIDACKLIRSEFGLSLLHSKNLVDAIRDNAPIATEAKAYVVPKLLLSELECIEVRLNVAMTLAEDQKTLRRLSKLRTGVRTIWDDFVNKAVK